MRVVDYDKSDLASGQKYLGKIIVEIIDIDGVRISTDSSESINIGVISNETKIVGKN